MNDSAPTGGSPGRRLDALLAHADTVLCVVDVDGRISWMSPAIERLLGHRPEQLDGNLVTGILHHGDRAEFSGALDRTIVGERGSSARAVCRLARADGEWRDVELTFTNLLSHPDVEGLLLTLRLAGNGGMAGGAGERGGVVRQRLERAIGRGELRLVYQPVLSLATGLFETAEALLRWQDPDYGLLMPGEFIPVAEATGLIVDVGSWVVREACRQLATWTGDRQRQFPPSVTINVSAFQLERAEFEELVLSAVAEAGIRPEQLGLEVTESALMANFDRSASMLWRLKAAGICIVLDDFGTGYSSLAYLRDLPLDSLKIDRSFIAGLDVVGNEATIVSTIAALGHDLGFTVVAEGVESLYQLKGVEAAGCDAAQGFLLSRPQRADPAGRLLGTTPQAILERDAR